MSIASKGLYISKAREMDDNKWKEKLTLFPQHTFYHLPEWFEYIEHTQNVERLMYVIYDKGEIVGYLPGFIVRKGPIKIFASPFEGWYTPYMGVLVKDDIDRGLLLQTIGRRFKKDGFHFAQFTPPSDISKDQVLKCGFKISEGQTFIAKVYESAEAVLAKFKKSTRYNVRRAIRDGLEVRFTQDKAFTDVFYDQLCQVFAKSNMRPTYSKDRVQALWDYFMPTGLLKATEVVYQDKVIATRLEIFYRDWMYAHGSASDQNYLKLKPNELARYHVMCYGAKNGIKYYDMMGGGSYKAQFGGEKKTNITAVWDPYGLLRLKNMVKRLVKIRFKLRKA